MGERAWRLGITEVDYHSDKLPFEDRRPSLSNSIAKVLLDKSPAHAHAMHPRLGGARDLVHTPATLDTFDKGKLAHALLLGAGPEIVVIDADDWRTKQAQEARAEVRAQGGIPVLRAVHADALVACEVWRKKLARRGIHLCGESEVKVAWLELTTDPVLCRGMLDHLIIADGRATIIDVKKTRDARPLALSNAVVRYGYDTQRAAYSRAIHELHGIAYSAIDFVFLFLEDVPPYAVVAGRLDSTLHARGEERWDQAVTVWRECLRTDTWPEYSDTTIEIAAPGWMAGDMEIGFEEEAHGAD